MKYILKEEVKKYKNASPELFPTHCSRSYSCPGVDENSLTARTHVFTSAVCTLGCDLKKKQLQMSIE